MPKYTHTVALEDGQNVTFTTPVKMSDVEIYQRAIQEQGIKSGRIPTTKLGGYIQEDFGGATDLVTNPELVAGAASFIPGVGTAAAGAIGAGTSVVRDLSKGNTDPEGMVLRAVGHGAVNMIPGGIAAGLTKKALPAATDFALGAATGGKLGIIKSVLSKVWSGLTGPQKTGISLGMYKQLTKSSTLQIEGVPLVSQSGLNLVKAKIAELANQGKAYGTLEYDVLDTLAKRITASLEGGYQPVAGLAKEAGFSVTNALERSALATKSDALAAAAKATQAARAAGRYVRSGLAGLSALTLPKAEK